VAWAAVVVAGVVSGGAVFGSAGVEPVEDVESAMAAKLLATGPAGGGSIIAVVDNADVRAPGVCDSVSRAAGELIGVPGNAVRGVGSPCGASGFVAGAGTSTLQSSDGRAFLVVVALNNIDDSAALDRVAGTIVDRLHQLAADLRGAGQAGAEVRVGGRAALLREYHTMTAQDAAQAERISLPITLAVLVFVFGGLVAAGLPVLAAVVTVTSAMVVLLGLTTVTDVDNGVITVMTVLGLGLSIDYGLLLVGRYRDEAQAGFAPEIAIGRACATTGRTIVFSALTVSAALAGLLAFGRVSLSGIGAAGLSVALVGLVVSLTFTPALLGAFRAWVTPPRRSVRRRWTWTRPWTRSTRTGPDDGLFARLSGFVQRRAAVTTVVTSAVLLAAGAPLLFSTTKQLGLAAVPRDTEAAGVIDELAGRFGQADRPALTVVARTDPASLDRWALRWTGEAAVSRVQRAEQVAPGLSAVRLEVEDDPQSPAAQDLVRRVRSDRPEAVESWVAGDAASLVDLKDDIRRGLPWAIAIIVLAMIVLLFLMTGSVVVPIKAVVASVVSLGATAGLMSAVFEHGFLAGPLHTITVGGLDPTLLAIVFSVAFGLSMDYEIFLLGRIREHVERGDDTETAVRRGLAQTGRVITSAAALMVVVFGGFASVRVGSVEQIGFGLTVAVLIDATIVRCLLVPATMTLMGRWNWWAPAPLRRLHRRIGLREPVLPDALATRTSGWTGPHRIQVVYIELPEPSCGASRLPSES
jgi:putative drug exporter of the RND superfamily